jgi:2-methylcitrate dehydratase PrpD
MVPELCRCGPKDITGEHAMTEPTGLSAALCAHVAERTFDNLPPATVAATKLAVMDGLGVMLAASGLSRDADAFSRLAAAAGGAPQATLLGRRRKVPMAAAAFANGALAHALDFEDAFDAAPTHPNASLLPAAFAVCEGAGPVSGRELLTAVAVGCDLVCRLALSVQVPLERGGWYPPPIFGAFGAVAAAARLLRLSPTQVRDAFSLLLCQNVCPGEIKYSRDTVIRAVREAFPAQAAVLSTQLALEGVRGFDEPFEGRAGFFQLFAGGAYVPDILLNGLGTRFWIDHLSFKQWPCCRGTHAFVEAIQALRAAAPIAVDDIVGITLEGDEVHRMLCEPAQRKCAPLNVIDAKFSLPFTVALALSRDQVGLDSFSPEALADPELQALGARCRFVVTPQFKGNAAGGAVRITLKSGAELTHVVPEARGGPNRPLTQPALEQKFVDCVAHAQLPIAAAPALRLIQRLNRLEEVDDVGALLGSL